MTLERIFINFPLMKNVMTFFFLKNNHKFSLFSSKMYKFPPATRNPKILQYTVYSLQYTHGLKLKIKHESKINQFQSVTVW